MLSLDPPDAGATIGGVVAAGDSGPLRSRYGGVRDLVVGIRVALSDGTVAKSGGKVIKNVAGYDLGKLFAGSLGTLGAILEVTVRLHPLPPVTATAAAGSRDPAVLARAASELAHAPLEQLSLDVRWGGGDGAVLSRFGGGCVGGSIPPASAIPEPPRDRLRRRPGPRARPHRRLRALRVLPPHMPHLPPLGGGDGLAPRADRADAAGLRGDLRPARGAHRPLSRVHGLCHGLPVRRPVRQAHRGHAGPARAQLRATGPRADVPPARVRALHAPRSAPGGGAVRCGGEAYGPGSNRDAPASAAAGAAPRHARRAGARRLPAAHAHASPPPFRGARHEAGQRRPAPGLHPARVLRSRQRGNRPGSRRRGLRGRGPAAAALLRRAAAAHWRRDGA